MVVIVVVVVVVVIIVVVFVSLFVSGHVEVMRCFTPRVLVNPDDPSEIGTRLGCGRAFGPAQFCPS